MSGDPPRRRLAEVAVVVVGAADHGVAEAEGRHGVLQRHVELADVAAVVAQWRVVLGAAHQDLVDDAGQRHRAQVVVDDQPLVVPAGEPARALQAHGRVVLASVEPEGLGVGLDAVDDGVVEAQKGQVELADDEVLVVAQVADEGPGLQVRVVAQVIRQDVLRDHPRLQQLADAREVAVEVGLGRDLRARDAVGVVAADPQARTVVETGIGAGPTAEGRAVAIDAVEVEGGSAQVAQALGDLVGRDGSLVDLGDVAGLGVAVGVGGQVVVDELAEVGVDGRDVGVDVYLRRRLDRRRVVDHSRAQRVEVRHHLDRVAGQVAVWPVLELREQVVERGADGPLLGVAERPRFQHDIVEPSGRVLRLRGAVGQDVAAVLQVEHVPSSRDGPCEF